MTNKKRIPYFLVIVLIIIYIIASIVLNVSKGKKYQSTVFIGSMTKIEIKDNIIKVYNEDKKLQKQKAKIYFNNKFIDGYICSGNSVSENIKNSYYTTDADGNVLVFDSAFIAYTGNVPIKIKDTDTTILKNKEVLKEITDSSDIKLLPEYKIDYIKKSIVKSEDGNNEYIYSVGLLENPMIVDDVRVQKYKSFVLLQKGDKYIKIASEETNYSDVIFTRLEFKELIDFNNDGDYEYVIMKVDNVYGPDYYELYNYDGIEFTKIGGE